MASPGRQQGKVRSRFQAMWGEVIRTCSGVVKKEREEK